MCASKSTSSCSVLVLVGHCASRFAAPILFLTEANVGCLKVLLRLPAFVLLLLITYPMSGIAGISISGGAVGSGSIAAIGSSTRITACIGSGVAGGLSSNNYGLLVGCAVPMFIGDSSSDVEAVADAGGIDVTWAPRQGVVTQYEVSVDGSDQTCVTKVNACRFENLPSGTYTFRVTTHFNDGSSSTSAFTEAITFAFGLSDVTVPVPLPAELLFLIAIALVALLGIGPSIWRERLG